MLLDDFFEILDLILKENSVGVKIIIKNDHKIFNGHFPDQPVVPGVCIVQMMIESLSQALDKKLTLQKVSNIKFLNIIDPTINQNLYFDISYQEETEEEYKVTTILRNENQTFFKFKGFIKTL